MKKTITMFLLTALCLTVFVSCDFGSESVPENQPLPVEVVGSGFLSVAQQNGESGRVRQLLTDDELKDWDGELDLVDTCDGTKLILIGYVAYNGAQEGQYVYSATSNGSNGSLIRYDVQMITPDAQLLAKIGKIDAEHLDVFQVSIPFSNMGEHFAFTVKGVDVASPERVFEKDIVIEKEIETACG